MFQSVPGGYPQANHNPLLKTFWKFDKFVFHVVICLERNVVVFSKNCSPTAALEKLWFNWEENSVWTGS